MSLEQQLKWVAHWVTSGGATLGLPNTPGVPEELSRLTQTAPINDLDAVTYPPAEPNAFDSVPTLTCT